MSKLQEIQHFLQTNDIDAAFITTPDNVFYMSGFQSDPHERLLGVMVFKWAAPFVICPLMEVPDVKAVGWPYDVIGHADTEDPWQMIMKAIHGRGLAPTSIAIEKSHLTVERMERLNNLFQGAKFPRIDDLLNRLRVIKDDEERDRLRKAAELADYAVKVGCEELAEGKTELEILMAIEFELKRKGVQKMAFDTMVLSGPKTASPATGKSSAATLSFLILVSFTTVIVPTSHELSYLVNLQPNKGKFMKPS